MDKTQHSIEMIAEKSHGIIDDMKQTLTDMSKNVRESNLKAIEKSFAEFNEFVLNFKSKFYIIQEAVASITVSTSGSLIHDLEQFSEDQINFRQKIIEKQMDIHYAQYQKNAYEQQLQGIENELKVYGGKDNRKHRKYLREMKTIIDTDKLNIQSVQWELKNDGIVPFANFQLLDFIADGIETIKFSREYNTTLNLDGGIALQWNIASLDKRETVIISYEQQGYATISEANMKYVKNISSPKTFRYRNLGQPITLTFIERDGKGAMILTNTGEHDKIWEITLEFEPNPDVSLEKLIIHIPILGPQESYIKKYSYSKAGILVPKHFHASTKYSFGVVKKRSTERDNVYNFELVFENRSEFLVHLTSFDGFMADNLNVPIFQVKPPNLDLIKPRLDFRKDFEVVSPQYPPNVVLKTSATLELVYDFDVDRLISIEDLKETPEKEIELKSPVKRKGGKAVIQAKSESIAALESTSSGIGTVKNAELVSLY